MPSTYTVNLGIEKPATGEQSGTWGDTTNVNFDIIDQAVNGSERVTLTSAGTSGSPNDLNIVNGSTTSSEGRNKWIEIYSASDLGGSAYVRLVPNDAEKILFIRNSLAGSQSVLLFQGTYNASNDLEIPAGVDMVVKFDGAGASATVTDVFTKLRATEITTPTLTAGTADINGGSVDGATVGAASASTGAFTTLTASTSLNIASSTTVDGVLDEDNMASDSATKLATQQSIKAYVDSQVGTVDTLAEILANGNTSGANNLIIDSGQALTSNTINETTAGSGVTIDSVLLKDDVVNATDIEVSSISANDGTAAATIANSTGNFTITNFISNSVDIGGGAIDGTNIGASSAGTGAFTTLDASGAFTGTTATFTTNGNTAQLTLVSTDDDDGVGPVFDLTRNSASPAADDGLAQIRFNGKDSGGNELSYAHMRAFIVDPTDGSEDGKFEIDVREAGGQRSRLLFDSTETAFNEESRDFDFRVESNSSANMLFVDAGNDRVGINRGSPSYTLDIQGNAGIAHTGGVPLHLDGTATGIAYVPIANVAATAVGNGAGLELRAFTTVQERQLGFLTTEWSDNTDATRTTAMELYNTISGTGRRILSQTGSDIVINQDGINLDFRVESDNNSHMLFVDAGNDFVGINKSTPETELHVRSTSAGAMTTFESSSANSSGGPNIRLWRNSASPADGDGLSRLIFQGMNDAAERIDYVEIQTEIEDVTDGTEDGLFQLYTFVDGTSRTRLVINSAESVFNDGGRNLDFRVESDSNANMLFVDAANDRVGIGNATPATALDVTGTVTADKAEIDSTSANPLVLERNGGTDANVSIEFNCATNDWYVGTNPANNFAIGTSLDQTNSPFQIDSSGNVGIGSASPSTLLQLEAANNASDVNNALRFKDTDTAVVANQKIGRIEFETADTTNPGVNLQIDAIYGGSGAGSELVIYTGVAGSLENRMFIEDSSTVFNQDGGDNDFRVESSGNTNMIFVDAGDDVVNIGTTGLSTAGAKLAVQGPAVFSTDSGTNKVYITRSGATNQSGGLAVDDATFIFDSVQDEATLSYGGFLFRSTNATNSNVQLLNLAQTESRFNDDGADIDFRVESDTNTHALFVDAGNNRTSVAGLFSVDEDAAGIQAYRSNQFLTGSTTAAASGTFLAVLNTGYTAALDVKVIAVQSTSVVGVWTGNIAIAYGGGAPATVVERYQGGGVTDIAIQYNNTGQNLEIRATYTGTAPTLYWNVNGMSNQVMANLL